MPAVGRTVASQLDQAARDIDTAMQLVATAVERLRGVLAIPDQRPGAWEAPHVAALEPTLRDVLALLTGSAR